MKEITFWAILNDQVSGTQSIEEEIAIFEKKNKIKVELKEFTWTKIWPNFINSVKEGNPPDVVQIGNSWVSILKEIDILENITELYNKNNYKENLYQISPVIKNNYYAVPWFIDLSLMFIKRNKKNEDLEVNTIDDIFSLCEQANSKNLFAIGGVKENILIQYMTSFLWANNGSYIQDNKINLLEPNNFNGIKSFFDLIENYGIKKHLLNIYGNIMWNFFLKDEGLFAFSSAWVINSFIKPHGKKNKFSALCFPGNTKSHCPYIGGSCLAVVKKSKQRKESIKFVDFLTSDEAQKRYLSKIGLLPASKKIMHSSIDNFIYKDTIIKSLEEARSFPAAPYWGSFEKILLDFIHTMFNHLANNSYTEKKLKTELGVVNKKIDNVIQLWER